MRVYRIEMTGGEKLTGHAPKAAIWEAPAVNITDAIDMARREVFPMLAPGLVPLKIVEIREMEGFYTGGVRYIMSVHPRILEMRDGPARTTPYSAPAPGLARGGVDNG